MLSINDSFYQLKNKLTSVYDEREAIAIAHEFVEFVTGLSKTQRLIHKADVLTSEQEAIYAKGCEELLRQRPLQYVTGSAWFMGREYIVNEHVLIPRPETEELVDWILKDNRTPKNIVDIGTGSGCIPISLKLALPATTVAAIDISDEALTVARTNAERLGAEVNLWHMDMLEPGNWEDIGVYDIIVSNPPYIPQSERANMHSNVTDHEPHLALFVPNDDALLFYRAIAAFGQTHLADRGSIYCELEQSHAAATKDLFLTKGYANTEIRKDMHGNWRMLKASKR